MHPSRRILKGLVELRLDEAEARSIGEHIQECELCQEFCDYYRSLVESIRAEEQAPLSDKASDLAKELFLDSAAERIIPLATLTASTAGRDYRIAADSSTGQPKHDFSLATLFSEDPDVVLRVMHDPEQKQDYLHLVSEDDSLTSGVLVQLPDLGAEFITDQSGHANIGTQPLGDYDKLRWQIRMPDAVFSLEPLQYDRDSVESSKEITLQSESQDEIQIRFETTPASKQISIKILRLAGRTDYGNLKVAVSQRRSSSMAEIAPEKVITFSITDPDDIISIRLFR